MHFSSTMNYFVRLYGLLVVDLIFDDPIDPKVVWSCFGWVYTSGAISNGGVYSNSSKICIIGGSIIIYSSSWNYSCLGTIYI